MTSSSKIERVDMTHGGGGRAMSDFIESLFQKRFTPDDASDIARAAAPGDDGAVLSSTGSRLVVSTDAHVVTPLFFAGGDIGSLAVHGTVNDLAMMGAMPLALTAAFILEEGLSLETLERIVDSMADAAHQAGVRIISGDTKVVEQGKGDGVFITTTGIGQVADGIHLSGANARAGHSILVSGTIGDHGVAILSTREQFEFETEIRSDSAALHGLVAAMLARCPEIAVLRDPTRGGLAATLNEIAAASGVGMQIDEAAIPVRPDVAAACELLGLDPLHVANEGKLVACLPSAAADAVLDTMRGHPLGRDAACIGEVIVDEHRLIRLRTAFGGNRIIDWLSGEQLPRIC